jgi:hypothetical protein
VLSGASCFEGRAKVLKLLQICGEIRYKYECHVCYNLWRARYHLSSDCTAGCTAIRTADKERASGYVKPRKQLKVSIISSTRSSCKSGPSDTSRSSSVLFLVALDMAVFDIKPIPVVLPASLADLLPGLCRDFRLHRKASFTFLFLQEHSFTSIDLD